MKTNLNVIGPPSKTSYDAEAYLYHHGITGQKHGIRNAGHYPLNAGDFSADELAGGAVESAWAQKGDAKPESQKINKSKLSKASKEAMANEAKRKNLIAKSQHQAQAKAEESKPMNNSIGEKTENQNESKIEPEKKEPEIIKNKAYYQQTKAGTLSDKELADAINRINQENKYNDLTKVEKKQSFGKKMVKKFVTNSIESIVTEVSGNMGKMILNQMKDSTRQLSEADKKKAKDKEDLKAYALLDKLSSARTNPERGDILAKADSKTKQRAAEINSGYLSLYKMQTASNKKK